jgi:hypothetical protein
MQFSPSIDYPASERLALKRLEGLFRDWHQHFADCGSELGRLADHMVVDGFYPHYFSQKKRILFIGWESVGIPGDHYIDILYDRYRHKRNVGDRHINVCKFHRLLMYITHGVLNRMCGWPDIPYASEICDSFGDAHGISFAFMNLSKFSNDVWQADHAVIDAVCALSTQTRNFIEREVAILEPDIVIAMCMNRRDDLESIGQSSRIHASENAQSFWLVSAGHQSLLVNTWHFSAWRKGDLRCFYDPICNMIRRSEDARIDPESSLHLARS